MEANDGIIFHIADLMVLKNPTPQTAIDIFKGTWLSKFPGKFETYEAGSMPLFDDQRIPQATKYLGSIEGLNVLDLGPLEGGIAYTLEKMGAKSVISVEANPIYFLKCLIFKEILGMTRSRFLCGDAVEYLKNADCPNFDMIV